MAKYLSFILFIFFVFFASCEDKQKSTNKTTAMPTDQGVFPGDTVQESFKESQPNQEQKPGNKDEGPVIVQEEFIPFIMQYGKENPETRVKITTRFGEIEAILYQDTPLHRGNFIFLAKRGYFNGTFFHRVAKGFVIQGGNSDNPETSQKRNEIGSFLIPSEFEAGHKHTRGAFSAAKYAEQNVSKASSPFEFFIVQSHRGAHHLDNDHTVFGRVTRGMDIVDKIAAEQVDPGEWPMTNIHMTVEIID